MSIEAMKQALELLTSAHVSTDLVWKRNDCCESLRVAIERADNKLGDEETFIFWAWKDSEAYQLALTEEGTKLAERRLNTFRKGWEYHKFYLEHGDVFMKDYLEKGPDDANEI